MSPAEVFWLGAAGGLIAEFIPLVEIRRIPAEDRPAWLKDWFYWSIGLVLVGLGGLIPLATLPADAVGMWPPIQMGAAAPAILAGLVRTTPDTEISKGVDVEDASGTDD